MSIIDQIRHTAIFSELYITPVVIVSLVILDVIALRFGIRESRERRSQIEELRSTARVYSRDAYELLVLQAIQRANIRIFCYWHSLTTTAEAPRYETFNKQLAVARTAGRDVRIITVKDSSRIAAARELIKAGVDVRFQQALVLSDMRFTIVDENVVVFGLIPEASGREQPSREGIDVTSRRLASVICQDFLGQWETANSYEGYLTEIVDGARRDTQCTPALVAEQLGIPNREIEQRWAKVDQS